MIRLKLVFSTLLFLMGCSIYGQKNEQQKLIEKAKYTQDSIMNTPEIKAIMKQISEMAEQESDRKPISNLTKNRDSYLEPTLTSNNNNNNNNKTLTNWDKGAADIVYSYAYDSAKDQLNYVKVGEIKEDGTIELNPTTKIPVLQPLNNFKNSNVFYDIHNPDVYQYRNEKTGFKLNSYLFVYQNKQKIGVLTIGNSEKVTRNLLTPGDLYYGDEGYILSWVYAENDCAIKANEKWKGDLSNTGTPLIVETNVDYNLSFKPGWNLVKTEVIGTYHFPNAPEEDRSRYKKHEHTIVTSIPNDATYYFRSATNY